MYSETVTKTMVGHVNTEVGKMMLQEQLDTLNASEDRMKLRGPDEPLPILHTN